MKVMQKMRGKKINIELMYKLGERWIIKRIKSFVEKYKNIIMNLEKRIGKLDFDREGMEEEINIGKKDWKNEE